MLLDANSSLLLLVDIQKHNINAIHNHEQLTVNCKDLLLMAKAFNVPTFASLHIPEKNGPILPDLAKLISEESFCSKVAFSCYSSIKHKIQQATQIVLAGIETHLCVLQTAFDFLENKKEVFLVADATDSKFYEDKNYALNRMQQAGVQIITKQMVLFEWARHAHHTEFDRLSEKILR